MDTIDHRDVVFEEHGAVCSFYINRPKAMNAITYKGLEAILFHERKWHKNERVKYIICANKQGTAFCAGAAINDLVRMKLNYCLLSESVIHNITMLRPKFITIADGVTIGFGSGTFLNSNIRIVTENTKFSMPETKIGTFTDAGSGITLGKLRNGIGRFLAVTATNLKGEDLKRVGLADYFIESKDVENLQAALIERINANPDISKKQVRAIIESFSKEIKGEYELENFTKTYFTLDSIFDIVKKLENNSTPGSLEEKYLNLIRANCPRSVLVSFEVQKIAQQISRHDYIQYQFGMLDKMLRLGDSTEGMDAFLNKRKPKWNPPKIEDLKETDLKSFMKVNKNYKMETLQDNFNTYSKL